MALLDDLVKLQFGRPLGESIAGIAQAIRESKAISALQPIVSSALQSQQGQEALHGGDLSKIGALTGQTLGQLLQSPYFNTLTAAQYASGLGGIAQQVLAGGLSESERRGRVAEAKLKEQVVSINDTEVSATPITKLAKQFGIDIPPELVNNGKIKIGELVRLSEADKTYIPLLTQSLELSNTLKGLSAASDKERRDAANIIASGIVGNLGRYALALPTKFNLSDYVYRNFGQTKQLTDYIAKTVGIDLSNLDKNAEQREKYLSISDAVTKSYLGYYSGTKGVGISTPTITGETSIKTGMLDILQSFVSSALQNVVDPQQRMDILRRVLSLASEIEQGTLGEEDRQRLELLMKIIQQNTQPRNSELSPAPSHKPGNYLNPRTP